MRLTHKYVKDGSGSRSGKIYKNLYSVKLEKQATSAIIFFRTFLVQSAEGLRNNLNLKCYLSITS